MSWKHAYLLMIDDAQAASCGGQASGQHFKLHKVSSDLHPSPPPQKTD